MPRSMAELAEAMPKVKLIPYPVTNPELHLADWWNNASAFGAAAARIRQVPARHRAREDRQRAAGAADG